MSTINLFDAGVYIVEEERKKGQYQNLNALPLKDGEKE
jgi:hypothetical protein